jgi:hypothetical protein
VLAAIPLRFADLIRRFAPPSPAKERGRRENERVSRFNLIGMRSSAGRGPLEVGSSDLCSKIFDQSAKACMLAESQPIGEL